jgi:hypothetical protein
MPKNAQNREKTDSQKSVKYIPAAPINHARAFRSRGARAGGAISSYFFLLISTAYCR